MRLQQVIRAISVCGVLGLVSGCASVRQAALYERYQAHAPKSAASPVPWSRVVAACANADVIFFGEEHNDVVCNQLEAELLAGLINRGKRPALSMEFFERDTQSEVDSYLAGATDEATFSKNARQSPAFVTSHRPLIQLAHQFHLPIVAANAPRAAVRAYRQSGKEYDAYRAEQAAADQALLPARVFAGDDAYRRRFFAIMGMDEASAATTTPTSGSGVTPAPGNMTAATSSQPASAPASGAHGPLTPESVGRMYTAQLVWDSAMAESIAVQREKSAQRPVLHVVGGFHVSHDGGLVQAYRTLRPNDRIIRIVYHSTTTPEFAMKAEDRDAGDFVIVGLRPESDEERAMRVK